jgi:predicted enzyme related to lactoylglutathione lyase
MPNANPVGWFEIPVENMERAKSFYEAILKINLDLNEMGGTQMAWFPMSPQATGAGGTLIKGEGYSPSDKGTLVYLSVDDIENTLNNVEENGGKTIQSKMSIGEHGFIGIFMDTEGNRLALHSRK